MEKERAPVDRPGEVETPPDLVVQVNPPSMIASRITSPASDSASRPTSASRAASARVTSPSARPKPTGARTMPATRPDDEPAWMSYRQRKPQSPWTAAIT